MSVKYVIHKGNFGGHLANNYPVEQIVEFMADKTIGLTSFGGPPCECCDEHIMNDYQEENILYHPELGFADVFEKDASVEYEELEFSVLYCDHCNKWFTYIE